MVDFITPAVIDIRANDAVASNTVGGNGQLIFNTTSNSLYVYDGVTVGGYKTDLTAYVTYSFQGSSYGFTAGGATSPPSPTTPIKTNFIGRVSLVSDTNQSDFSDLSVYRTQMAGTSSTTSGYTVGGIYNPTPSNTQVPITNQIEKFSFTSASIGVVSASAVTNIHSASGHSTESYGYSAGGNQNTPTELYTTAINQFSHTSDANATDIGELSTGWRYGTSNSSDSYGYTAGGRTAPPTPVSFPRAIQKFPFSTSVTSTNIGNLVVPRNGISSSSSTTHGYAAGGWEVIPGSSTYHNEIEKWPFSSDTNATDVGDILRTVQQAQGISSTSYGYTTGGVDATTLSQSYLEKYPFSSDTGSSDVGTLNIPVAYGTGHQV